MHMEIREDLSRRVEEDSGSAEVTTLLQSKDANSTLYIDVHVPSSPPTNVVTVSTVTP